MATVVCLRKEEQETCGTDEYDQLEIVDGQQRLTTLIILLKTIAVHFENKQNPADEEEARKLNGFLVKPGSDTLLLLQTNHDVEQHFVNFLRDGEFDEPKDAKTLADRELLEAMRDSQKFVERWEEDGKKLGDLLSLIKNRLSFVLYEISDKKSVYTVFEVLNSRGMEVSWLDRLKSILMGKAHELDNEQSKEGLRSIWTDIYRQIGLRQGLRTEALRFAATLYEREQQSKPLAKPLGEKAAVEALRKRADNATNINKVARWLLKVTKACDKMLSDQRRNAVTRISQARLLGVAILLKDSLSAKEKKDLLDCWEKVSFRIYGMMSKDSRTSVGDYVRLAWRVVNDKQISVEEIESEIKKIGREFPIEDARAAMRTKENFYEGWAEELRYLMFRYEEHLAKEKRAKARNVRWKKIWEEDPDKSIEHIIPQSKASDDVKHSLGNLMLLPPDVNSGLKDKPPEEKFSEYHATGLRTAQEVVDRAKTKKWGPKDIQWRKTKILKWAAKEWGD